MTARELIHGLSLLRIGPKGPLGAIVDARDRKGLEALVSKRRRRAARELHPDHGGDVVEMQHANATAEWLLGARWDQLDILLRPDASQAHAIRRAREFADRAAEGLRQASDAFKNPEQFEGFAHARETMRSPGMREAFRAAFDGLRMGKTTRTRVDLETGEIYTTQTHRGRKP